MAAQRLESPRPGHAPCHACLLLKSSSLNPRSSWRRICDDCADQYVTKPLPVPIERVRYCPDTLGVWGQSREIYQSWDTGLGATVPARKYNLAPAPAGKAGVVAVVLQDAADASALDAMLGPLATKPDKPFMLRYCSSIKSFCADDCFSSSQDKSCLAHIKQRKNEQQRPAEKGSGHAKRERLKQDELVPGTADTGWLLNEIPTLWESSEDDCFGDFALGDIYDLSAPGLPADDGCGTAPLAAIEEVSRAASPADTISTLMPTPRESPALPQPASRAASWNGGEIGILNGLDTLLGGRDGEVLNDASWTQSAVDVAFDDALGAALNAGTAPRCFTVPRGLQPTGQFPGRPPLVKAVSAPISKQYMWAPGASRGKTLISKPREGKFSPSKLPMKTADASRQGPTQKAKCVWKQQIMW